MKYIKIRFYKKKKKQDYLNGEFRKLKDDIQKQPISMLEEFVEKFPCKVKKYWLNLRIRPNPNITRKYQITTGLVTTEFCSREKFSYKQFYNGEYHTGHPHIWTLTLPSSSVYIRYESDHELSQRWNRFKKIVAFL